MRPVQKILLCLLPVVAIVSAQYGISDGYDPQGISGGLLSSLFGETDLMGSILGGPFSIVETTIRRLIVAAVEVLQTMLPSWVFQQVIPDPILGMLGQNQIGGGGIGDYNDLMYPSEYGSVNSGYN